MRTEDFAGFYEEIHDQRPFPWQRDLVEEIVSRRSWPTVVDIPTGLGKTAMLDIALFLTALDADKAADIRIGRRRIFFVVDRRIVVDQAEQRAQKIAAALAESRPGSVAAAVAQRLNTLRGPAGVNEPILPVVRMRGGVTWDAAWLPRPDQPGIVTGTVDQVGSRLLFRGYGVSRRRWPIDAALVGMDSLVLVDEAHLATALTETLGSALGYDTSTETLHLPPPAVAQLSATARGGPSGWGPTFDEEAHLADPVAVNRLRAAKTLRLETTTKQAAAKAIATAAVTAANGADARVLVVCNTIDRARAVHTELRKRLSGTPTCLC